MPPTFGFFDFKNPFAKFCENLSRTCKELAPRFNRVKFSENSNIFHELVRLTRNMSHPTRLDGLQCYNYIFKHCKRLILRLIIARSIKSMLVRLKALKTSNTRLYICVYIIKSYTGFIYLSMYEKHNKKGYRNIPSGNASYISQLDSHKTALLGERARAFLRLATIHLTSEL